ncbi:ABC transporter ATP-binding protein [Agromyces silvae]|uniref:ABC transporter ATP-binding protein n=1 Tax=Agromyces silvae TaxID=3388266 RepID=UPI00280B0259|nr:ABC transporter ATP-binding protein [Agromyces protaetiae]
MTHTAPDAVRTLDAPTPAPAQGRLSLVDVTKRFGPAGRSVTAVDGVSIDIKPGEFVTLLGPSGCGKTTLLRMIAGFEQTTDGGIRLDGADLTRISPDKRPMAMVFQSYALFPHMTVRENVAYGLKIKKRSKAQLAEEVDSALTTMNLLSYAERAPHQLSGGQQQRVALARALVMRPKVLLFDEPLSNLDAKLRIQMRAEIRRIQRRLGITAVFVTHDQDEAIEMSDRIVVLRAGQIEQIDTAEGVYHRPASTFVADFIGRANFVSTTLIAEPRDGMARVHVLGRELTVPAHPGVTSDGASVLVVRPETVEVSPVPEAESDEGGDIGHVLARVFRGSSVEYDVETDGGNMLVTVSDPDAGSLIDVGAPVRVRLRSPERSWLLPQESQPSRHATETPREGASV